MSHLEGRTILTKTDVVDRVEGKSFKKTSKKRLFSKFCGNSEDVREVCCRNVGSCKSDVRQHCQTMGVQLLQCITDYKRVVSSQTDVTDQWTGTSDSLLEFLEEMLHVGIELQKTKKIRG